MRILILFLICILCVDEILNVRKRRSKNYEPRTFTSCFEELGCIDTTEKWFHEKYRPKNLEPLDKHTIRTEFLLMKNANELVYDVMNMKRESIEVAGFKTGTCTIFVIHDFTSNGYTGWIKHLVLAFTKKTDCNIISIDWQAGAEPPFEQAIANARVVALETKLFITLLSCAFSQSTDNIHLIGHGVGGHIAGYVGKYIKGIQRITGLDPTGPMFEKMPKEVRLDFNDAKYVEILHTDNFNHRSQGGRISHGHADFIINNAEHQPGCNDSSHMPSFLDLHRDTLQEGKILPACSHKRAFKYYIQALEDDECQFIGLKCDTYKDFQLGKCNDCFGPKGSCATFGLEPPSVTSKNNTYYMITNGKKPFCMVSYSVNVTIATGKSKKESEGFFEMILVDFDDKVTNATSNVHGTTVRKFETGHTYKFVFYALPPRMGRIKEAKVKWNYKSKKICIMCDKSVVVHDIGIRRLTLKPDSQAIMSWICPLKRETEMKSGDYIEFVNCEDLYGPKYPQDHLQPIKSNKTGHAEANPNVLAACGGNINSTNQLEKKMSLLTTTPIVPETLVASGAPPARSIFEDDNEVFTGKRRANKYFQGNGWSGTDPVRKRIISRVAKPGPDLPVIIKDFKDCFDENSKERTTTTPATSNSNNEICENMAADKKSRKNVFDNT
ncbi:pancreatic triacylglycerol lipase-like isoform X2 [Atheta coriaria]|uniref:pancreatic triacylglycerol lipase-like isoform X2 n=1 Tax=Dalotia coriaria TaxID=877792 RepID=UPI0031F47540